MRIFIVGMPGSGKSTLGKFLARELDYRHVDTDRLIEEREGFPPGAIILQQGEKRFRELEREVLLDVLTMEDVVVSTGGGFPAFSGNMDLMVMDSLVIYIRFDLNYLWRRLRFDKTRPLSSSFKRLSALYEERREVYEKAQVTVSGSLKTRDTMKRVMKNLKARGIL
jgi:shikimate kinase